MYKIRIQNLISILIILIAYTKVNSQSLPPPAKAKFIEIDLFNQIIKDKVPFDFPFVFIGTPTDTINTLTLKYKKTDDSIYISSQISWTRDSNRPIADSKTEKFYLIFSDPFLKPNTNYQFKIEGFNMANTPYITSTFNVYTESSLSDHVKLDFGVGYAYTPRALIGLTSVHFYFTPINDDTDLGSIDLSAQRNILLRTSMFFGISPTTFFSHTKQDIQKRFTLGNLVYGIGIRSPFYGQHLNTGKFGRIFLQPMRVNLGVLNFAQDNANQLITKNVNKRSLFTSITYDFNISTILGPVGKLIQ